MWPSEEQITFKYTNSQVTHTHKHNFASRRRSRISAIGRVGRRLHVTQEEEEEEGGGEEDTSTNTERQS